MPNQPEYVLYIVSDLLEGRGGIQSVVMSIFENMDRSRVQIDFVVHQDYAPSFVPFVKGKGSRVYQAPQFKKVGPLAYISWWNRFFTKHPEYKIVHGHMKAYISLYLLIAKLHGRITIAHSHAMTNKQKSWRGIIHHLAESPLRWVADYHFACSVDAGKSLFGRQIVAKRSFRFVPNARNTPQFVFNKKIRQNVRQQLKFENNFVIGYVGRLSKEKNLLFLVDVFAEVYTRSRTARLLIVGDGSLKRDLVTKIQSLGLSSVVVMVGLVPNPQDYYQAMDVFLFPSLFEGLGMVLTEAQIAGLPCVFSANLPQEIEIAPKLCHRISLEESAEKWAEVTLAQAGVKRVSRDKEAAEKGFEITTLAKKLEDFYIQVTK